MTAGLIVAAGSAALSAARLAVLRSLGPGLALTVLTAMVVAVTLTPALIAVFGRLLFLPGRAPRPAGDWRERAARAATSRRAAVLIAAGCMASLLVMAASAAGMRLAVPLIRALPGGSEAVRAQATAARAPCPGYWPQPRSSCSGRAWARSGPNWRDWSTPWPPGPAWPTVVGPADVTAAAARRLLVAGSGNAVRFAAIESTDPLGAAAIGRVRALREDLPAMARSAGLAGVRFEAGGQTAISADAIDALLADLWRVALAIALVTVVLLALFLRSLLAPVYLLAASVLALLSAFGLTVWIFQEIAGYDGLVYYVPVAVAVLLVALGSDYNVFVVGHIWDEARRQPLPDAVATAVPRAWLPSAPPASRWPRASPCSRWCRSTSSARSPRPWPWASSSTRSSSGRCSCPRSSC